MTENDAFELMATGTLTVLLYENVHHVRVATNAEGLATNALLVSFRGLGGTYRLTVTMEPVPPPPDPPSDGSPRRERRARQ